MKKLLFALLLCAGFALPVLGQSNPPLTVTEPDGSPRVTGVTTLRFSNGSVSCSGKVCTVTTGGGGGGTPGGANTQVQYNNAGSFGGAAGFTFNGTSTISLGVAGSSVGAIGFRNATSGTITLQPVTGALGTVTLSLPAVTDTLVGLAATQTLSNKTLASPGLTGNITGQVTSQMRYGSNVIAYEDGVGPKFTDSNTGAVLTFNTQSVVADRIVTWPNIALTVAGVDVANSWADGVKQTFNPDATTAGINVGSVAGDPSAPANGDLWYDSTANELTARINGANVALGAGGGGITVGTTTVTSGTATRLFYETAGNVVGQISGVTSDGTSITALPVAGVITQTSNSATAFESGPNGGTNPVFRLVNNVASAATGLSVTGNAAGSGVTLTALSSGTDENIHLIPKGIGRLGVGTTSPTATLHVVNTEVVAGVSSGNGTAAGDTLTITGGTGGATTDAAGRQGGAGGAINITGGTGGNAVSGSTSGAGGAINIQGGLAGSGGSASAGQGIVRLQGNGIGSVVLGTGSPDMFLTINRNGDGITIGNGGGTNYRIGQWSVSQVLTLGTASQPALHITTAPNVGIRTSTFGTSAVGVLAIANGTAPSSSPADEFQLYSADSAAGDANAFARNEAGEVNRLTGLSARNSSSFAKTSDTTLANITGLTRNVEAGRTYYFETELSTTSANTGGVKFAISGTATATAIDYEGVLRDGTTISAATRATALDTTVCAVTAVTAATCRIRGVLVVGNAGTITVQFAQNASDGGASTVLVNQALSLRPIS